MKDEKFESITGFPPAEHQRICTEALAKGKSVILRAPTGSGKSEAVWLPFLLTRGQNLPMRMIHALPMRALVNQLESRLRGYLTKLPKENGDAMRVAAMHGKRPESVLFYADAIFATLDQVVTSYVCTPLSLGVRHGNIPAGAIPGSFLVFDEVHTFEPELGLQAVLVLAERAIRIKIPFVIMSATLPRKFLNSLVQRWGEHQVELIEGERLRNGTTAERSVMLRICPERLTARAILHWAEKATKTLVVVNTVDRAQELYEAVKKNWDCPIILAHSRFYDDDRQEKEKQIESLFGKKSAKGRCLLIATQVVEVGLDISCDRLLTELAPIDALVQRVGRCVRWGGTGEVVVFTDLETKRPYEEELVVATEQALQEDKVDGQKLTWELEKALIDQVLDPYFSRWAKPEAAGKVLASLAEAAFTGNSKKAERAVRDTLTVEVALHDSPSHLGSAALKLPRCRLHPKVFHQFLRGERKPQAWHVVMDRDPADDWRAKVEFSPVGSKARLMAGGYYIVDPQFACYDAERGLRLGVPGQSAKPLAARIPKTELKGTLQVEPWKDHILKVVRSFENYVQPKEQSAFVALACLLKKTQKELLKIVKLVLIFHDLGKLTREWQRKIKSGLEHKLPSECFLAHRGERIKGLPPHATVSAWVVTPCLCREAGSQHEVTLAIPALAAIAHHHSVRADTTPRFEMADGWFDVVADCTRRLVGVEVAPEDFNTKSPQGSGACGVRPNFLQPVSYTSYVLVSRWLRLADRIATGGDENAILQYEGWMQYELANG